jgi:tripartite-type tricarboxylate transporter receptor subunit TctC
MRLPRRVFLRLAASVAALPVVPHVVSALDYPVRPIRIIVGLPAGQSPDLVAPPLT